MASPARTATVTKIPCGQQPSSNTCPTPKPARRVSDRSSSPHGSKLPVRKTSFVPGTSSSSTTAPNSSSSNSRHPAASSKSLPTQSNMGTAFQKSGAQGSAKQHSKSTFGFGSKAPAKGKDASGSKQSRPNCATNSCESGNGSGGNGQASSQKPTKIGQSSTITAAAATTTVVVPTAIGITKASGTGKDEGYSTMSSEALAETISNSLEKSPSHQRAAGTALTRNSTFSIRGGGRAARNANTIPCSSTAAATVAAAASAAGSISTASPVPAARTSLHKSNTFNTFREIASGRHQAGDEADDDDEDVPSTYGVDSSRRRIHSLKSNYLSAVAAAAAGTSRISQETRNPSQDYSSSSSPFTSLPNSSTSSPSKGKLEGGSTTTTTPKPKRSAKSACCYNKDRITATTRMMDGNIVRIVRGSPYSVRLYAGAGDDDSADTMDEEEDPSSSTILWEDSDDSDILFLPLEVSASSAASSRSTLVPPPQSSGESRSYYSSWGTNSSMGAASTNTYCSTLENGSNSSVNNSAVPLGEGGCGGGSNTFSRRAYPLRRTKGEVTVDVLINRSNEGGGPTACSKHDNGQHILLANSGGGNSGIGNGIINEEELGHLQLVHSNHVVVEHDDNPTPHTDELEERALIEKWMQLEEVRNEQVQGGEQWAWDWDGVERTYTRVLKNAASHLKRVPFQFQRHPDDEEDDLDVDLILEESMLPPPPLDMEQGPNSLEERNNAVNDHHQFDSSTWTKSKKRGSKGKKEADSESAVASPEKVRRESESASGTEQQILLVLEGERDIENEAGSLIKTVAQEEDGELVVLTKSRKSQDKLISLDESVPRDCMGVEADGEEEEEDDPPPVIEFTPEFYRLANFGSNLSFSDNETTTPGNSASSATATQTQVPQSPKVISGGSITTTNATKLTKIPSASSSPKKKRLRKTHNSTNASNSAAANAPQLKTPTDDKISQTDFSCSSLENISSVSSSELSQECRNCLDIIKKLVGQAETDAESEENGALSGDDETRRRQGHPRNGLEGKVTDAGSYATTWISVPKGIPTNEVSRLAIRRVFQQAALYNMLFSSPGSVFYSRKSESILL